MANFERAAAALPKELFVYIFPLPPFPAHIQRRTSGMNSAALLWKRRTDLSEYVSLSSHNTRSTLLYIANRDFDKSTPISSIAPITKLEPNVEVTMCAAGL